MCFALPARAAIVQLNADSSLQDASPYLDYLIDDAGSITLPQLLAQGDEVGLWQPNGVDVPNFGFTRSAYWFRLRIHNRFPEARERFLQIQYPLLAEVDVFQVTNAQLLKHMKAGSRVPFARWPIPHRNLVFPLEFEGQSDTTLYLKVVGGAGMQVPVSLWRERDFWIQDQAVLAWQFGYYGLMLVMVLYNLILAWGTRDTTYLYYVIFTAGICLFQMLLHGTAYQYFWPTAPQWNYHSIAVTIPLANTLSTLCIVKMLRIQQHNPIGYRLLLLQVFSSPFLAVASYVFQYEDVLPFCVARVVESALVATLLMILRWRAGDQDARYFVVAWIIFVVGCFALALNKMGVLPFGWVSENMMQIGSAVETILLSLALTARINRMREDGLALEREQLQVQERSLIADKKVLEAKYESKAKSEFLAVMSHEIRTPMNGVLGVVELLRDTHLSDKQVELVETIQSSGKLLLNIINDILDFSKIESGKLEIEHIDFNLRQLVDEAIRLQIPVAQQKGLLVATFVDPSLPEIVQGDPSRLKQVMYNLMGNAIKFTASGHLFLRLRKQEHIGTELKMRIDVLDSGIGMTREQRERLFQSFSQADRSTSRKFGGTGLGLAISKKLVEAMGGEIGVESAPHFGSSFWFHILLNAKAEGASAEENPTREHWYFVSDYVPLLEFIETSLNKKQFSMHSIVVQDGAVDWTDTDVVGRNVLAYLHSDARLYWGTLEAIRSILDSKLDAATNQNAAQQAQRPGVSLESAPFRLDTIFVPRKHAIRGRAADGVQALSRGSNLQHLQVLVAEDNLVNQMVIRGLLRPLVGEVDMVANGREALERFVASSVPYDLVFMDCEMPEMDGYEATRRIREHEKRSGVTRPTIVVALTAHAFDEYRDKAYACGMNQHLSKPVTRDVLYRFLTEHYGHLLELDQRSPRFNNDSIS